MKYINDNAEGLSSDLIVGAAAIALFLFGSEKFRRQIYYLREKSALPIFLVGGKVCARKSTLQRWMATQEKLAVMPERAA